MPLRSTSIDAALGDLALQPCQELAAGRAIVIQVERLGGIWLRGAQEGSELDEIDGILAVVVLGVPSNPATSAEVR